MSARFRLQDTDRDTERPSYTGIRIIFKIEPNVLPRSLPYQKYS